MINKVKEALKSDFLKNAGKLASGTMLAQVIAFVTIPIIARLYSQDAFGLLTLFIALVSFISSFATLKYDTALVIPEHDRDAYALLKLSNIVTLTITLLSIIVMFLPIKFFENFKGLQILIGLGVILSVNYNNSALWNIRFKKFNHTAISTIVQAIAIFIFQYILYNYFQLTGLVIGNLLGVLVAGIYLVVTRKFSWNTYFDISKKEMLNQAKRFIDFPKYFTPSNAILSLSSNLPILLFSKYISLAQLGLYGIAIRIIGQPVALISNSIRSVVLSELASKKRAGVSILGWYYKVFLGLLGVALISALILIFSADFIIRVLLGEEWAESAAYVTMLSPLLISMMISPPSGAAVRVFEMQKYNFKYSIFCLCLKTLILLSVFNLFEVDFKYIILIYALTDLGLVLLNNFLVLMKIRKYEKFIR
ncbi:oligosaccharide flippase family protein [Acinetobacter sp. YH12239]|uniref:oligosaccharide flippase family protein n=1 Tax=Acinetobacter sp. YH12239 TaxID=2601166 RepID=UPI0015D22225|nr:oligosaccharide flippase family protein [Acinetobacter sp. YH12239]